MYCRCKTNGHFLRHSQNIVSIQLNKIIPTSLHTSTHTPVFESILFYSILFYIFQVIELKIQPNQHTSPSVPSSIINGGVSFFSLLWQWYTCTYVDSQLLKNIIACLPLLCRIHISLVSFRFNFQTWRLIYKKKRFTCMYVYVYVRVRFEGGFFFVLCLRSPRLSLSKQAFSTDLGFCESRVFCGCERVLMVFDGVEGFGFSSIQVGIFYV